MLCLVWLCKVAYASMSKAGRERFSSESKDDFYKHLRNISRTSSFPLGLKNLSWYQSKPSVVWKFLAVSYKRVGENVD